MIKTKMLNKRICIISFVVAVCTLIFALLCCSCQHYVDTPVVESAVRGIPGETTVKNILKTGFAPVGNTMYIQGGGWNDDMSGGNSETNSLGVSEKWKEFFDKNADTISKETAEQYNANHGKAYREYGLNESGYVGWVLYNVFNNKKDYCFPQDGYNTELANLGLGQEVTNKNARSQRPGDIMVCKAYDLVYITLGACEDGSLLYLCCNYPGAILVGSTTPSGDKNSIASNLANDYINKYMPDANKVKNREPIDYNKLTDCTELNWNNCITDPDGYRNMKPTEILNDIFSE